MGWAPGGGYVYDPDGQVVMDPDEQVRAAVADLLAEFTATLVCQTSMA